MMPQSILLPIGLVLLAIDIVFVFQGAELLDLDFG